MSLGLSGLNSPVTWMILFYLALVVGISSSSDVVFLESQILLP